MKLGGGPAQWMSLWPLALALVIYVPGILGKVPFSSESARYTDLLISHYPNAVYLKFALLKYKQIPLWSPLILSGYPFAANPLSGMWYPPGWVALLFPLPHGLSVALALHALWGGVGMFHFLRRGGAGHAPAVFGATAFMLLPKASAHYGAGHVTLLYAISWTPWLLSAVRHKRRVAYSSLCLAAIFLADPRWAAYSGVLWLAYQIAYSQHRVMKAIGNAAKSILVGGLLAAPLALPMAQYVVLSTRWGMDAKEVFTHSLAPAELLGLLFPSAGRDPESALYAGGLILALAAFLLAYKKPRREGRFWVITAGVSLIYALGTTIPGVEYLATIPGISLLRVPTRSLFLLSISLVVLAVQGLDVLQDDQRSSRPGNRAVISLGVFAVLLLTGVGLLNGYFPVPLLWGLGMILCGCLALMVYPFLSRRDLFFPLVCGILLLDGVGTAAINVNMRPQRPSMGTDQVIKALGGDHQWGAFRTYSPSYSIPQHLAADKKLELADGVDPLQLRSYVDFMERATGIPHQGYSVTLPPLEGEPSQANQAYTPRPNLLALLNVRYVIADFPLQVEGLNLASKAQNQYVYQNQDVFPRAWVQPADRSTTISDENGSVDPAEIASVKGMQWSPNKLSMQAVGPGTLVLSEVAYPGWQVRVDGELSDWSPVYQVLRGVELPEGSHTVEFLYRPRMLYLGLFLCLIGLSVVYWGR